MAPIHLLVLIHGMWGNPGHLAELARIARETHSTASDGTKLHVLLAEANREDSTYDGIDWGGERVADEVRQRHDASPTFIRPLLSRLQMRSNNLGWMMRSCDSPLQAIALVDWSLVI